MLRRMSFQFQQPSIFQQPLQSLQPLQPSQPLQSLQPTQLKEISDQLKEIKDHLKIAPVQTNIYIDQIKQNKSKTQSSTLQRKPRNPSAQLPFYVISGNANCDRCFLSELIYGYHYGIDSDVCVNCFNEVKNKEGWIEFSI